MLNFGGGYPENSRNLTRHQSTFWKICPHHFIRTLLLCLQELSREHFENLNFGDFYRLRLQTLISLFIHWDVGVALVVVAGTRLEKSTKEKWPKTSSQSNRPIEDGLKLCLAKCTCGRKGLIEVLPQRCVPQRRPWTMKPISQSSWVS